MAALAISTMNSTRRPIAGFSVSSQLRTIQPRYRMQNRCGTYFRQQRTPASGILEFRSSVFIGLQHAFDFVARIADFGGPSALGLHESGRVSAAADCLAERIRHALFRKRKPAVRAQHF